MLKTLKVGKKSQRRKHPIYKCLTKNIDVPFINIAGLYLKEAGFEIGQPVKVLVLNDCIILKHPNKCEN